MKQKSVLIVDNNSIVRRSLKVLLSRIKEFEFTGEACNGEEAVRMAKALNPEIILMDINMSPVNGFDATSSILKENSDIKIVGVSLHEEIAYQKRMKELGARGYVSKSSSPDKIIDTILKVAGGETCFPYLN